MDNPKGLNLFIGWEKEENKISKESDFLMDFIICRKIQNSLIKNTITIKIQ